MPGNAQTSAHLAELKRVVACGRARTVRIDSKEILAALDEAMDMEGDLKISRTLDKPRSASRMSIS